VAGPEHDLERAPAVTGAVAGEVVGTVERVELGTEDVDAPIDRDELGAEMPIGVVVDRGPHDVG